MWPEHQGSEQVHMPSDPLASSWFKRGRRGMPGIVEPNTVNHFQPHFLCERIVLCCVKPSQHNIRRHSERDPQSQGASHTLGKGQMQSLAVIRLFWYLLYYHIINLHAWVSLRFTVVMLINVVEVDNISLFLWSLPSWSQKASECGLLKQSARCFTFTVNTPNSIREQQGFNFDIDKSHTANTQQLVIGICTWKCEA